MFFLKYNLNILPVHQVKKTYFFQKKISGESRLPPFPGNANGSSPKNSTTLGTIIFYSYLLLFYFYSSNYLYKYRVLEPSATVSVAPINDPVTAYRNGKILLLFFILNFYIISVAISYFFYFVFQTPLLENRRLRARKYQIQTISV